MLAQLLIALLFLTNVSGTEGETTAPTREYRVKLASNSYLRIIGSTNVNSFTCGFEGEIPNDTFKVNVSKKNDKLYVENGSLVIPVKGFDCGNKMMNQDFLDLLRVNKHPEIRIMLTSLDMAEGHFSVENKTEELWAVAEITFFIAGESKKYPVPIKINQKKEGQYFEGTRKLDITEFNLEPPKKFMGLIQVQEEVIIDFSLNLTLLNQ